MIQLCSISSYNPSSNKDELVFYMKGLEKFGDTSFLSGLEPSAELQEWKQLNSKHEDCNELFFRMYSSELKQDNYKKCLLYSLRDLSYYSNVVLIFSCEDKDKCYRSVLYQKLSEMDLECELM